MDDLDSALDRIFRASPLRMVLSRPQPGDHRFNRSVITLVEGLSAPWQIEEATTTQTFHTNVDSTLAKDYCRRMLQEDFSQLDAWSAQATFNLRITKKGRVLFSQGRADRTSHTSETPQAHDRQKHRIIAEGTSVPALVDLGVFTPEGRVRSSMQDKYRQINRFVELVDDTLSAYDKDSIDLIDFGCGKSYLTFILYHYLTEIRGLKVNAVGLDLKRDVIDLCNATARRYGYDGLHFEVNDIAGYHRDTAPDLVVTLHACDTATDHALFNAMRWGSGIIMSVPCCQHEIAGQMSPGQLPILSRYGIIKERSAALMTDAMRANLLVACGYHTDLLEFVDFEHKPKNILIRAVRTSIDVETRKRARIEVETLMGAFDLDPTLYRLLDGSDMLVGNDTLTGSGSPHTP